ncbi:MAG TPA: RidA family protein [Xanthobacteraceae bacterium]|jgi:enamine deaminase RidA (YjgF/YER057c/UK114 family)
MIESVASMRGINPPELGTPPGYSQVVEVRPGRLIFIAGQTAVDKEGKLVGSSDFAAQAKQVFRNLSIALRSVGCTANNLVKLTVFLRSMENLSAYREVLFNDHAACGSSGYFGGSVETLWPRFLDRN